MPDYVKLAAVAKRLIENAGRNVTFRQLGRQSDDPTKPWRGSDSVRTAPANETLAKAVFVDPVSAQKMGFGISSEDDLVSKIDLVALVAATSSPADLELTDEVVELGVIHRVEHCEVLKPGDRKLLYIFLLCTTGPAATVIEDSAFTLGFNVGFN